MSVVTRADFLSKLSRGLRLDDGLRRDLAGTGVEIRDLQGFDRNLDGLLAGAELRTAYALVDGHDRNGLAASFSDRGAAGPIYRAMLAHRRPEPNIEYRGPQIAAAARARARDHAADYDFDAAPTSPYAGLSGNTVPNQTHLKWLASQNKCNQFAGDVLTDAGMQMPTVSMRNGGEHFASAEMLPRFTRHFDRVTSLAAIQPGDLIVVDHPARGASTAHVEVVVEAKPLLITAAAHFTGASESTFSFPTGSSYVRRGRHWRGKDGDRLYVLRPKRARDR